MSGSNRSLAARIAIRLLVALLATIALLLVLLPTIGPLFGFAFYLVLLWRCIKHDYQAAVIGGVAGLVVHGVEIATSGWSACPILMALNLILPALLVFAAVLARQ